MKKSKRVRLLALLLAVCSIVAIASGCNKESTTTGDPGGQQGTSTAPEPSTTVAPTTEPKPTEAPEPTGGNDEITPGEEQKYYLSGTWLMNETLVPLAELTGKNQKEVIEQDITFIVDGVRSYAFKWTFNYLALDEGYTSKTFDYYPEGIYQYDNVYSEGKAFCDYTCWKDGSYRTVAFPNKYVFEVSKTFYSWFLKNATKISDDGIDYIIVS